MTQQERQSGCSFVLLERSFEPGDLLALAGPFGTELAICLSWSVRDNQLDYWSFFSNRIVCGISLAEDYVLVKFKDCL